MSIVNLVNRASQGMPPANPEIPLIPTLPELISGLESVIDYHMEQHKIVVGAVRRFRQLGIAVTAAVLVEKLKFQDRRISYSLDEVADGIRKAYKGDIKFVTRKREGRFRSLLLSLDILKNRYKNYRRLAVSMGSIKANVQNALKEIKVGGVAYHLQGYPLGRPTGELSTYLVIPKNPADKNKYFESLRREHAHRQFKYAKSH